MITVLLDPKVNAELFSEILRKHDRHVSDAFESKYRKVIGQNELYWYATGKMCDCGTALGSFDDFVPGRLSLEEVKKLERKGWSKNKIQRRIDEQEKYIARKRRENRSRNASSDDRHADPDGWVTIITELLGCPGTNKVGIIKHWYTCGLKSDVLEKKNRVPLVLDEELGTKLFKMEEDVCYEIRA